MRNIGVALAMGGAVLAAAGCQLRMDDWGDGYYDDSYDGYDTYPTDYGQGRWVAPVEYLGGSTIQVDDARLSGRLGQVSFRDGIVLQTGESYPGTTVVSLYAGYVDWAVMTQISVQGSLAHEALVPGALLRFDANSVYTGDPNQLAVTVLGCAGTTPGAWEVDQNASSVEVRVSEGTLAGNLRLQFVATFETSFGTQSVGGEFEYSPDEVTRVANGQPSWNDPYAPSGTVMIDRGTVRGDMGSVRGFSGDAWLQQATGGPGYGSVELQAQGDGWATMAMLSFDGGLDHAALVPGAHLEFDLNTYQATYDGSSGLFITVIGCAGDRPNEWSFDQSATKTTIDVSVGSAPGRLRIDFSATFDDGYGNRQTVTGSFEMETVAPTLR